MPETLVQRARTLSESALRVQTHQRTVQDARRLRERTEEVRRALETLQRAAQRWQVLKAGQVPLLSHPDPSVASAALARVQAIMQEHLSPPDAEVRTLRLAVEALTSNLEDACASAWSRYTASRTSAVGLASMQALQPEAFQALTRLRQSLVTAQQAVPATVDDVRRFNTNLDQISQRLEAEHVREIPEHLTEVLGRVRDGGLRLSELTTQDLQELKQRGLDRKLRVHWSPS